MNGFPATGYGNWRQYRRRQKKALKEANPAATGVQCRKCVGKPAACRECLALFDDWGVAHFGVPGDPASLDSAAARIAAR